MRRILVLRYRFLGDTVLLTPFLRQLHVCYPHAQIAVISSQDAAGLLENQPGVDRILDIKTVDSAQLRAQRYDVAFVLKRSWSSAWLAWRANIPIRIGFNTEGRGLLLTHRVPYRRHGFEADCFLDCLRVLQPQLTSTLENLRPQLYPSVADDAAVEQWWREQAFQQNVLHVALCGVSTSAKKQWPVACWQQVLEKLALQASAENRELCVHTLGVEADIAWYEACLGAMAVAKILRWENHAGRWRLLQSAAVLRKLSGVFGLAVGIDSGPMQMATAMGLPSVVLFAPMVVMEKWQYPDGLVTGLSLEQSPDAVFAAVQGVLVP